MNPASESPEGSGSGSAVRDEALLEAKHKVFLSHSGAQKNFVEQVCVDLERYDRYPFFDKRRHSLGIGQHFPEVIFQAIRHCQVGVLILSEEFFTCSKWPMLELAAMVESKKQNSELVIMPVFLGISKDQCRNVENHKRWESTWLSWKQTDPRIDVEKWKEALLILGPTNGLIFNDVLGEVAFRQEIVQAICSCVPPETGWDDSHVQGRSRLCQVLQEKVNTRQVCKTFGVRLIGLYGVGGLGKTTICKTLCNSYTKEFEGRVAHVEFESDAEVELMRGVLRKLTDTRCELLAGFNKGECRAHLKAKVHQHNVFLAIDNVSDTEAAIEHARVYLRAGFTQGSVVIITARSMEVLKGVGIVVEDCVKMPKLDANEARSLFLHQVLGVPEVIDAEDEVRITRCVELCQFREGNESHFGYLPLALKLLGIQSSTLGYNPKGWVEELPDTSNKVMGSVFDILRRSFDALGDDDKLLFMDVVIYYPRDCMALRFHRTRLQNIPEWLSIVYQTSVKRVKSRLQELKRKSVIEEVGDRIGVHELWREFAIMETKAGELESRRWVHVMDDEKSGFDEVLPSGTRWGALQRMCFIKSQRISDKVLNVTLLTKLQYCSNVTVLHLMRFSNPRNVKMLDLTPLKCLKSLLLEGWNWDVRHGMCLKDVSRVEVRGLGTLKSLGFLSWTDDYFSSANMEDIACLTSLEYLGLSCRGCEKLPDLSKLKLLRALQFGIEGWQSEPSELSSKMTRLQQLFLKFFYSSRSKKLGTCTFHGISNLMALEELMIKGLVKVEEVCNLQMLTNLQRLTISSCESVKELRGFDDPVALNSLHLRGSAVSLQELKIFNCRNFLKLPHMGKLKNLRILDISWCSVQSLPGLGELVALEVLRVEQCPKLSEIPDLHKLWNLQKLELRWCALRTVRGLDGLEALYSFSVEHCDELVALLPGLCKLRDLRELDISQCSSLKPLPSLESLKNLKVLKGGWQMVLEPHKLPSRLKELTIHGSGSHGFPSFDCDELNSLPTLPGVHSLKLWSCNFRAVSGLINCTALQKLEIKISFELERLPDLPHLKTLDISHSETKALNMGFLPELERLSLHDLAITELPDLSSCCPKLSHLRVDGCKDLRSLTSSAPLSALTSLALYSCRALRELPDLTLSTKLEKFAVEDSGIRLTRPKIQQFSDLTSWPDVEWEARRP